MATAKEIEAKRAEDARNALAFLERPDDKVIELTDENYNAFRMILSDEQILPDVEEQNLLAELELSQNSNV